MRSTAYFGVAVGTLWVAATAPADDSAPGADSIAQMPPNPVTSPAGDKAAPAPVQPPAQPKKICHSMDVAGSKIPKRVCATQEEWATFNNHQREDTQDGLRHLQDQGANSPASPGVSASQLPPGR